jgi:lincosamide and streptogramin A transport system ATP-binding/permease protein
LSLISINNLSFAYEGSYDNVFEDVTLQLDSAWRIGFVGRNGRGKTTLLRLLMGKLEHSGTISRSLDVEYFPFEIADDSELNIDIVTGITGYFEQWQLERELSLLAVDEDVLYRPFCTLSNGERTKLMLAALFLKENSFLLIDEPTNHLDSEARDIVGRYLQGKKGFILVSHDRAFLDNCVDHILAINKTNVELQSGSFSSWWNNKQNSDKFEQAENERLKKEVDKLSAAAKRTAEWSDKTEKAKLGTKNSGLRPDRGYIGHKSAKMMARSKSISSRRENAAEEKSKLLKNIETAEKLIIRPKSYHSQRLLTVDGLNVCYGEKRVLSDCSFTLNQGERLLLKGRNGSGKSSILKLLAGEEIPHTGRVELGSRLELSYVSQDASFLRGSLRAHAEECGIDESLFKTILRKMDFSRTQFEKDMADFSQGQKKKVLIAESLCRQAHLYIWDEPMNYIDLFSRLQLEELILNSNITMIFVEHDTAFADKVATKTVNLHL